MQIRNNSSLKTEIECQRRALPGKIQTSLKRAQPWFTGWQRRLWDAALVELAGNMHSKVSGKADHRETFHQRYFVTKQPEVREVSGKLVATGCWWPLCAREATDAAGAW